MATYRKSLRGPPNHEVGCRWGSRQWLDSGHNDQSALLRLQYCYIELNWCPKVVSVAMSVVPKTHHSLSLSLPAFLPPSHYQDLLASRRSYLFPSSKRTYVGCL